MIRVPLDGALLSAEQPAHILKKQMGKKFMFTQ